MHLTHVALFLVLSQSPGEARGPSYRIAAKLDEVTGKLTARAQVVVRNTTPRPLAVLDLAIPRLVHLEHPSTALDSGIVTISLPRPLLPNDSTTIELAWSAQPIRRQGREFAFASWQPTLANFGSVRLRLDVPSDQVVSGTGFLVCGDPGWRSQPVDTLTWRGEAAPIKVVTASAVCDSSDGHAGADRKIIAWRAEHVTEIALALSPDYRYEQGDVLGRPMRAFYRASDAHGWGSHVATSHLETAFAWLDEIFGDYPWPQATVLRTSAGPDTVVAMQVWAGNADQLPLMRALGRMYSGVLVSLRSPEDAWLEEALARFQATWYLEAEGLRHPTAKLEREVLAWDLDGVSQPIAQPRGAFYDSATATAMIERRGELFLHELRAIMGDDALRLALHSYFATHRFGTVDEASFRAAAESAGKRDLASTFTQWLHGVQLVDYSIGGAQRQRTGTGWRTEVRVDAHGPTRFPMTVWVLADADTGVGKIPGHDAHEVITVSTHSRPWRVLLDPEGRSHDWNVLNNQHTFRFHVGRDRPTERYIDTYFRRHSERDRITIGVAPIAWRTDRDGWTVGLRRRDDYLGRFELNEIVLALTTGWDIPAARVMPQASILVRNPVTLQSTGWGQQFAALWLDGRAGASIGIVRNRNRSVTAPARHSFGLSLDWLTVHTPAYVDPAVYNDAGTVELTGTVRTGSGARGWNAHLGVSLGGGYQYANAGATPAIRNATYGRITAVGSVRSDSNARLGFGLRLYGGVTASKSELALQRRIFLAGADPYERMSNPFLRSQGAILARSDVRYDAPGGAGMRGLDPRLSASQAYGASIETEATLWRHGGSLARRASLAFFADGALADDHFGTARSKRILSVAEAGPGIRIEHRLGATTFQTRWDFPLWISRPALAQDRRPGTRQNGYRWVFSFSPSF